MTFIYAEAQLPPQFRDMHRHWSSVSEQYTGCDALFTRVQQGWKLSRLVLCEEFTYSQGQKSQVFHFQMVSSISGEIAHMPVISTPHVVNFIHHADLLVLIIETTHAIESLSPDTDEHDNEIELEQIRQFAAAALA